MTSVSELSNVTTGPLTGKQWDAGKLSTSHPAACSQSRGNVLYPAVSVNQVKPKSSIQGLNTSGKTGGPVNAVGVQQVAQKPATLSRRPAQPPHQGIGPSAIRSALPPHQGSGPSVIRPALPPHQGTLQSQIRPALPPHQGTGPPQIRSAQAPSQGVTKKNDLVKCTPPSSAGFTRGGQHILNTSAPVVTAPEQSGARKGSVVDNVHHTAGEQSAMIACTSVSSSPPKYSAAEVERKRQEALKRKRLCISPRKQRGQDSPAVVLDKQSRQEPNINSSVHSKSVKKILTGDQGVAKMAQNKVEMVVSVRPG